ncbi:AAA family ATPase [Bittarella massiliensis (ex Durand et al. 2017)]|uniref:AAA family ATPase n=1 Tax=Bittarella massiliensis (ex Durand et al. 2017) TaxID=1720313 RepID=UPI001AA0C079|nr:AAA family ATPase [Bittarella massiliensis (ex Durand et al. 2017)]MBO1678307.1 AAA family ATPase [Bittarella massiliensis (ex Durand et al. 2017)]
MKKQLIVVNGTMGVGKTATCQALKKMVTPSVFLDGDWCWDMEPFVVSEENKKMVMENIAFLLRNFLQNSSLQYVLFGWVIHQRAILDDLLGRLAGLPFDCRVFTLVCTPETLRIRLQRDVERGLRTAGVIPRSLDRLPLYGQMGTKKIDVSRITAREAAAEIAQQITVRP